METRFRMSPRYLKVFYKWCSVSFFLPIHVSIYCVTGTLLSLSFTESCMHDTQVMQFMGQFIEYTFLPRAQLGRLYPLYLCSVIITPNRHLQYIFESFWQCCGTGSGRIRIILPDPDLDSHRDG